MCLRAFLAALTLVVVPATSAAPALITAPIDQVARAKFPKSDPELVDIFADINRRVNRGLQYVSDEKHYGNTEKWVMFPEDGKGDCEDFALTKMEIARRSGFPVLAYARIRGVVVKDREGIGGHAILEVRLPDGAIIFLDNRFDEPMTRTELVGAGYKFFDW